MGNIGTTNSPHVLQYLSWWNKAYLLHTRPVLSW